MKKRRRGAVVVCACIGLVSFGAVARGSDPAPPAPAGMTPASTPVSTLSNAAEVVRAMAASNGELHPIDVAAVVTTRGHALSGWAPEDQMVEGLDRQAYLFVVKGRFNGALARKPMDAPAPTGTVMTVVVDVETGQVTDWGLDDRGPDLGAIGAVEHLS